MLFGLAKLVMVSGGGGYPFVNNEAAIYVAAMSVEPDDTRKALIDAYVGALKTSGVWALLDVLYLLAARDAQSARLNLKAPGTFTGTANNSPTFTTDRGYAGNGFSANVDTGYNPTVNGANYTLTSATIAIWSRTSAQGNGSIICGNTTVPRASMTDRTAANQIIHRLNEASTTAVGSITDGSGLLQQSRNGDTKRMFRNGSQISSNSVAPTGLPNQTFWILGGNNASGSSIEASLFAAGGDLGALAADFYSATLAYMQGVGAA